MSIDGQTDRQTEGNMAIAHTVLA